MDDCAEIKGVIRALRRAETARNVLWEAEFIGKLAAEILAPIPPLPENATARERYYWVLLSNQQAHARTMLEMLAQVEMV